MDYKFNIELNGLISLLEGIIVVLELGYQKPRDAQIYLFKFPHLMVISQTSCSGEDVKEEMATYR